MVRRTAGYLAVLLVTAYLFFMYDAPVLSGILVFCAVYPAASGVYLIAAGKKVVPDLERVPPLGEKGKKIKAGISVKNKSGRLSLRYEFQVAVRNSSGRKCGKKRFRGVLIPKGEETVWLTFDTEYCGVMEICLDSIRIYDFLGIFYRKVRWKKTAGIKVMPQFELMPLEITRRTREFQADAQEFSQERRGDDPSEIYQVREYREKDSLKDIHWKLSAREEQLMVKERSFPLGCVVLIYIDYRSGDRSAAGFSKMLETVASLTITLVSEKCIHMAAWYEEKNERLVRWHISDEESACDMIWNLMEIQPYRDAEKAQVCYDDAFRGQEFSSVVTIDRYGNMKNNGESFEFLRL